MRPMKDSGHSWLGQIPASWPLKKGKYVFEQKSERGNMICLQLLSPTQNYGVIPQGLYEELSGMTAVKLNDKTDLSGLKTVHRGAYVISLRSFQGGFEYSEYEGVVSPAYQVFYPTVTICDRYYKYMFKDRGFIEKMNSYTISLRDGKNIAFSDFGNTYIPLPSLDEQQRIADFLDNRCAEIDALTADVQKEIETLQEYRRSLITETVTKGLDSDAEMKDSGIEWIDYIPASWDVTRIGYESWIRARLGWKGLKADEYVDEGYPFLSAFNIVRNKPNWKDLNFIDEFRYQESPEIKLRVGDLILVKDGAGIGKCARIDELPFGPSTTNGSLAVITPGRKLEYRFLHFYLQSAMFQNYIIRMMNGMGVPHLSQEELRKIVIPLPPMEDQKSISDYLDLKCSAVDQSIEMKEQQIETLSEYRKSLIYEYVTGKKEVV